MLSRRLPSRLICTWKSLSQANGRRFTTGCVYHSRSKSKFSFPEEDIKMYEHDYVQTPVYPPIDPELRHMTRQQRDVLQKELDWRTSIKNSSTVEGKNIQLNINRLVDSRFTIRAL